jgi:hypothetical protein
MKIDYAHFIAVLLVVATVLILIAIAGAPDWALVGFGCVIWLQQIQVGSPSLKVRKP